MGLYESLCRGPVVQLVDVFNVFHIRLCLIVVLILGWHPAMLWIMFRCVFDPDSLACLV